MGLGFAVATGRGALCGGLLAALLAGATLQSAADAEESAADRAAIRQKDLARHIEFLASDTLEGREAGTRGGAATCQYIVQELKRLGLQPAGEDGRFTQDFPPGYRNVLAMLPAEGPEAAQDVILIGGHYDHVGYGRPENSQGPIGLIHNGADDNASGTSAVLEIAEALVASDVPRRCSIVFAFWDAEEINLNGSEHWCTHPTLDLARIRLAINLDMIGRLNERVHVHGARTAAGLRTLLARANAEPDLFLEFHDDHPRNSDHYSFLQQRIPYLMLDTGEHEDYHRPTDDIDRLNWSGLERITQLLCNVVEASSQTTLPSFRADCLKEARRRRTRPAIPQRLGITWNARQSAGGLQITSVLNGSAAARAGLRAGDVLERFGGRDVQQLPHFPTLVALSPRNVTVTVRRPGHGEPLELEVTLDGDPLPWGFASTADPAEPGVETVSLVLPDSPASAAGLRPDDRILEWAEENANVGDDATAPGAVQLLIERNGRLQRVRLTRAEVQQAS